MSYSVKLLLVLFATLPLVLLVIFFGVFDRHGKFVYKIGCFWAWAILKIAGVRLKIEGLRHVDPRQQYIFMANHQSNIDIPVLIQSLSNFQLRWVAKKELLFIPLFGWALWASKHILVDRSNRSKAMSSFKKAKEQIEYGVSVVVFPEGTRSATGEFLPFKRGGFLLALKTKVPIVPITINGSGAILPKGDWRLRGGEVKVVVAEPVLLDSYQVRDIGALSARVRDVMESHSDHTPRPFNEPPNAAQNQAPARVSAQR